MSDRSGVAPSTIFEEEVPYILGMEAYYLLKDDYAKNAVDKAQVRADLDNG